MRERSSQTGSEKQFSGEETFLEVGLQELCGGEAPPDLVEKTLQRFSHEIQESGEELKLPDFERKIIKADDQEVKTLIGFKKILAAACVVVGIGLLLFSYGKTLWINQLPKDGSNKENIRSFKQIAQGIQVSRQADYILKAGEFEVQTGWALLSKQAGRLYLAGVELSNVQGRSLVLSGGYGEEYSPQTILENLQEEGVILNQEEEAVLKNKKNWIKLGTANLVLLSGSFLLNGQRIEANRIPETLPKTINQKEGADTLSELVDSFELRDSHAKNIIQVLKDYDLSGLSEEGVRDFLLAQQHFFANHQGYLDFLEGLNTPAEQYLQTYADLIQRENGQAGVDRLADYRILDFLPDVPTGSTSRGHFCYPINKQSILWLKDGKPNFPHWSSARRRFLFRDISDFMDIAKITLSDLSLNHDQLSHVFSKDNIIQEFTVQDRNIYPYPGIQFFEFKKDKIYVLGYVQDESKTDTPLVIAFKILEKDSYGGMTFAWKALSNNLPDEDDREKGRQLMYSSQTSRFEAQEEREAYEAQVRRIESFLKAESNFFDSIRSLELAEEEALKFFTLFQKTLVKHARTSLADPLLVPDQKFTEEYTDFIAKTGSEQAGISCILNDGYSARIGNIHLKDKTKRFSLLNFHDGQLAFYNIRHHKWRSLTAISGEDIRSIELSNIPEALRNKKKLIYDRLFREALKPVEVKVGDIYVIRSEERYSSPVNSNVQDSYPKPFDVQLIVFQILEVEPKRMTIVWKILDHWDFDIGADLSSDS